MPYLLIPHLPPSDLSFVFLFAASFSPCCHHRRPPWPRPQTSSHPHFATPVGRYMHELHSIRESARFHQYWLSSIYLSLVHFRRPTSNCFNIFPVPDTHPPILSLVDITFDCLSNGILLAHIWSLLHILSLHFMQPIADPTADPMATPPDLLPPPVFRSIL